MNIVQLLLKKFLYNKKSNYFKVMLQYVAVFTIVLSFALLLYVNYYNTMSVYEKAEYDYIMTDFDKTDIEEVKNKEFTDSIYLSRLLSGDLLSEDDEKSVLGISIYLVDNYENRELSYFAEKARIKGEYADIENGISIDIATSRKLGVSLGDKVFIPIGEKNDKIECIVTEILEPTLMRSGGTAVMLYNDYFKNIWKQTFNTAEDIEYSFMFVKVNDEKTADKYMYEEFTAPGMSGCSKEENVGHNYNVNTKHQWSMDDAASQLEYTPKVTVIVSILGCILIIFIIVREVGNRMVMLHKQYAILTMLGIRKGSLLMYIVIERLALTCPAVAISLIAVKSIIYDRFISSYYLPWRVMLWAGAAITVFVIIASFAICFIGVNRFEKKNISVILSKE